MSDLINSNSSAWKLRWNLLGTVSAMTLFGCIAAVCDANASNSDENHSTVWIELGGQLEHIDGSSGRLEPDFATLTPIPEVYTPVSPVGAQRPARYGFGGDARISIEPEGTNWTFSAALRYGRSNTNRHVQKQAAYKQLKRIVRYENGAGYFPNYSKTLPATFASFSDTRAKANESHAILDFQAGKDVGLGMLGRSGRSTVFLGVRFAQFMSRSEVDMKARPEVDFHNLFEDFNSPSLYIYNAVPRFHVYSATGDGSRNFHGVGPSLSWDASSVIAGDKDSVEFSLAWGVSAAILFGRQKTHSLHQTSARYFNNFNYVGEASEDSDGHNTKRSIVVPNLGAFVGASVSFPNSKVTIGYRGDIFFGAMDVGIDTRKSSNLSFHGPFASISVGLGG